ncbi:Uncharacterized protein GBIM_09210, partial [Gryllus bimaculatus]
MTVPTLAHRFSAGRSTHAPSPLGVDEPVTPPRPPPNAPPSSGPARAPAAVASSTHAASSPPPRWRGGRMVLRSASCDLSPLSRWQRALAPTGDARQCRFPSRWEGAWFQSGVRQPIYIERDRLSSKGRCVASEGDNKGVCFRCVVIHEKHINVLQYKETFCHPRESLPTLCSLITGDALLYSMFRVDAAPVVCPFRGPFTFTYNRGHGECASPVSSIDSCTEDSRLLLRYQACPDVHGTESTVEELQCLATWKEGSSRYLVGKVHHSHATSNEDRYRCFVYEKSNVVSLGGDGIIGGGGPG